MKYFVRFETKHITKNVNEPWEFGCEETFEQDTELTESEMEERLANFKYHYKTGQFDLLARYVVYKLVEVIFDPFD
jgi:hypothetical protein